MIDNLVDRTRRRYPGRFLWTETPFPPVPEALPNADQTPWRRQDYHQEDHPDDAFESVRPEPVANVRHPDPRVVVDSREDQRTDPRALQPVEAADHGDDQDVDGLGDVDAARRDLGRVPDRQDPRDRRDERPYPERERTMQGHVVAKRLHAGRVVADALERQAKRSSRQVANAEVD